MPAERMKHAKHLIAVVLLSLPALFLLWMSFMQSGPVFSNWGASANGTSFWHIVMPYYAYQPHLPHLYFGGEMNLPDGFSGYVLRPAVDGCFENVTVNGMVAYQNLACPERTPHEELAVDVGRFVHSGGNQLEFTVVPNGGTMRFEVFDYRKFNLLRFAVAVALLAMALFLTGIERRYVFFFLLASIVFLHVFSSWFPVNWGFLALQAFPRGITIILAFVAIVVSFPVSYDLLQNAAFRIASRLDLIQRVSHFWRKLRQSSSRLLPAGDVNIVKAYVTYAVMFAVSFAVFWIFRTMHSLGDAGSVGSMPLHPEDVFFPTSPLASWFLSFAFRFLRNFCFECTSFTSTALVSCFAGAASVPALWLICREVFDSARKSIMLFSLVVSGYFIQLFFGYIEFYPLLLLAMAYFFLAGVYYLKGRMSIFYPSLAFSIMFCTHLSSGFFGPSLLALYACRVIQGTEKAITGFVKMSLTVSVVLLLFFGNVILVNNDCVRGLIPCVQQYVSSLKGVDPGFFRTDLLTLTFLQELLNEYILVAAGAFVLLFTILLYYRKRVNAGDSFTVFFLAATAGFFLFTAVHMTGLGLPRDWDVLAAIGLPLMLLSGYVFITVVADKKFLSYSVFSLVSVVLLVHTIPALLDSANKEYVLSNPLQAVYETGGSFIRLLGDAHSVIQSSYSPLKLIDVLDVGDVISERGHSYALNGEAGNGSMSAMYADGTVAKDTYRSFTGSETFIVSSVPGKNLVVVRRVLCPSDEVTWMYLDGYPIGKLQADCNGTANSWKDVNVTVSADVIHGDSVDLMLVSDGNKTSDSYRYWIYAEA
jgi:hypothetical protein